MKLNNRETPLINTLILITIKFRDVYLVFFIPIIFKTLTVNHSTFVQCQLIAIIFGGSIYLTISLLFQCVIIFVIIAICYKFTLDTRSKTTKKRH